MAALSGEPGPAPSTICLLLGSTAPFSAERLAELYDSKADYLKRYRASVKQAIRAGWVLPQDRKALMAFAEPEMIER